MNSLEIPNLLLVSSTLSQDGNGVILHLRELEGGYASVDLGALKEETGANEVREVSILEEPVGKLEDRVVFDHFETKFLRLDFSPEISPL